MLDFLDTDADGDGVSDTVEAYDFNGDGIADVIPYGRDSNQDGIDDAYESYLRPDSIRDAWRQASVILGCRQVNLRKKIRKIYRAQLVLTERTQLFNERAQSCGNAMPTQNVTHSRKVARRLRKILTESYSGAIYQCSPGLCYSVDLSLAKRRMRFFALQLGALAKAEKLHAIQSCEENEKIVKSASTRRFSDDYSNDLLAAIGKLPREFERCS